MISPKRANLFMLLLLLYQFVLQMVFYTIFVTYESGFASSPIFIIISQVLSFGFPIMIYFSRNSLKFSSVIPRRRLNLTNIGLITLMSLAVQPAMMVLSSVTSLIFENRASSAISSMNSYPAALVVIIYAINPAVLEELVFRGIILANYKYVNIRVAALINGLFFAIMHMDPHQFCYALALGMMLTYIVHYTQSISAAIFSHFVINFTQIILSLNSTSGLINIMSLYVMAIIMLPVFIIIFNSFVSYNKRINNTIEIISYFNGIGEPRPATPPKLSLWMLIPILAFYAFYLTFIYDVFRLF